LSLFPALNDRLHEHSPYAALKLRRETGRSACFAIDGSSKSTSEVSFFALGQSSSPRDRNASDAYDRGNVASGSSGCDSTSWLAMPTACPLFRLVELLCASRAYFSCASSFSLPSSLYLHWAYIDRDGTGHRSQAPLSTYDGEWSAAHPEVVHNGMEIEQVAGDS
jgi:hypothetical protein